MQKQHGTYSQFKGVSRKKSVDKWLAQCDFGGQHRWLGFHKNEVDAARAYDHAAVQECGEYARVNFPQEWPLERRREVHAAYQAALKRAGKKNTSKAKAEGNKRKAKVKVKKKAKAKRKPHPTRPKTKKLPPRQRKTRSQRNHQ